MMVNRRREYILWAIIAINTAIFLAQLMGWDMRTWGALHTWHSGQLHIWQFVTHMFLHANVLHLLMNMYAIYLFGQPLLLTMSGQRFLCLYFAGGVFGGLLHFLGMCWQIDALIQGNGAQSSFDVWHRVDSLMLGASGAACALLGAFAVRFPHAQLGLMFLPFGLRARYFVLTLVIYEIFAQISGISLFGENVAHLAHVGGVMMGVFLIFLLQKRHINLIK